MCVEYAFPSGMLRGWICTDGCFASLYASTRKPGDASNTEKCLALVTSSRIFPLKGIGNVYLLCIYLVLLIHLFKLISWRVRMLLWLSSSLYGFWEQQVYVSPLSASAWAQGRAMSLRAFEAPFCSLRCFCRQSSAPSSVVFFHSLSSLYKSWWDQRFGAVMDAFSLPVLLQILSCPVFGIHLILVLWLCIILAIVYILHIYLIYQFYKSFICLTFFLTAVSSTMLLLSNWSMT